MLRESALEHRYARILVCEAATLMRADDFYTAIDGSRIRSFDATTVVTLGSEATPGETFGAETRSLSDDQPKPGRGTRE